MNKKNKSLLLCTTPLQMLIAEQIIKINSHDEFDLLVINPTRNDKYNYYFNRVSKLCNSSLYYEGDIDTSRDSLYIKKFHHLISFMRFNQLLKSHNIHKQYSKIYIASIDDLYFRYIISNNKDAHIYTFDDGTANIIDTSIYYTKKRPKLIQRVKWRILGLKFYEQDLRKLTRLHYTIYKDVPNITTKTKYIELFNEPMSSASDARNTLRIFLGQPLKKISDKYNESYLDKILRELKVDVYYPHPREIDYPKDKYNILNSPLIFEDYLIQYLTKNPTTYIYVYSFISGTLLNIAHFDRVKPIYIHDKDLYIKFKDFYKFSQEKLNIKSLSIEEQLI